ncbi:hypothetical protein BDW59DRAFT_161227 [Aspergillus cavernicola]|uniref:Uncharacterized protein n=1 Tax=Aspergillus cavernicola TaxID=176166 RepID=A0ABR4IEB1_9EURO
MRLETLSDNYRVMRLLWRRPIRVLGAMALACVAFALPPSIVRGVMKYKPGEYTFKLLHIRVTARDRASRDLVAELQMGVPLRGTRVHLDSEGKESMSMGPLADFAIWAFSPTGLSKLMVIAYGDFAHGQRYRCTQLLLCRNAASTPEISFRIMTQNEY